MRLLAVVLVLAPAVAAQAPDTGPYGFHLGLSSDGAALVVQWFTRVDGPSHVDVTTPAGAEVGGYDGVSELLPQGGEFVHSVELAGLAPGDYAYSVEGADPVAFRVPGAGDDAHLAFIADQGVGPDAKAVTDLVARESPDAVFHAGDIAYAEGDPAVWDAWFEQVEPVAASTPWLPAVGNHETYFVVPVTAFVPLYGQPNPEVEAARARFALPGEEVYWSWDVGRVHVVALDSFWTELAAGSAEATWLADDLARHADADWTVAFFHDPPFSSGAGHGSNEALREVLSPILEAGGVDVVVTGHDHVFERTWPLKGDVPAATASPFLEGAGVVYVVSGGGGAELYGLQDTEPAWSAFRASAHEAFFVRANATALVGTALRPDGAVLDTFTIERPPLPAPLDAPATGTPGPAFAAALAVLAAVALMRRQ